jgi:molybdate transport system ATP-binding protein
MTSLAPADTREAALAALRELGPERLIAAFQPHLYSRTKAFAEQFGAALALADEVAVLDGGRNVQRGTAAELAATPASGLVADLAGAVVLTGIAAPGAGGLTRVALDGGGVIFSTDAASGPVAAGVFPWEIALEPAGPPPPDASTMNRIAAEVTAVTEFGNRARVGLRAPHPLAAEVTAASVARLGLRPGVRVAASWKATATRLAPR